MRNILLRVLTSLYRSGCIEKPLDIDRESFMIVKDFLVESGICTDRNGVLCVNDRERLEKLLRIIGSDNDVR